MARRRRAKPPKPRNLRLRGGVVLTTSAVAAHAAAAMAALGAVLASSDFDHPTMIGLLAGTSIAIAIISGVATNHIVYHMFTPLRELRRAMRQVGRDQLGIRMPETGFRDIAVLCRRFNVMAERLEQSRIVDTAHTNELERDIAQRAAELERANEKLRTLDDAKDAFLSSVSHEMRTPLTSIIAAGEILREFTETDSTHLEFLTMIDREAQRLLKMIESILDFAKFEAEEIELDKGNHDLHEIVTESIYEMLPRARERGITLQTHEADAPLVARCDRARIQLVIQHLVDNAIKFSPEKAAVDIVLLKSRDCARIEVKDRGLGVTPERRSLIFRRLVQESPLLTDKPTGVGIGLALGKRIADIHGGDLHYQDRDYRGSCFVLTLPLAKPDALAISPQSGTSMAEQHQNTEQTAP